MKRTSKLTCILLFALLVGSLCAVVPSLAFVPQASVTARTVKVIPVDDVESAECQTDLMIDLRTTVATEIAEILHPDPTASVSFNPRTKVETANPGLNTLIEYLSVQQTDGFEGLLAQNPESVLQTDDRTQITTTTNFPWNTICKLYIEHPTSGTAVGTGFFVDDFHVLTAGHCVYLHDELGWPSDAWADEVTIIPAMDEGYAPYGKAKMSTMWSYTGWTNDRNHEHDWGLIRIDRNLGTTVGWMGRETAPYTDPIYSSSTTINSAGYPGDRDLGLNMYYDYNTTRVANDNNHWYYVDTAGGQSGMPIWRLTGGNRYVQTVHAYGNDGSGSNHGTRLNQNKYDQLNTWLTGDAGNQPTDIPDLVDTGQRYSLQWDAVDPDYSERFGSFTPSLVGDGTTLFSVETFVTNFGRVSSGAFTVSFYASTNTIISTGDYLIGTDSVSSLSGNGNVAVSWAGAFPSGPPSGNYYVGWIIDSGTVITEHDESNNRGVITSYQLQVDADAPTNPTGFTSTPSISIWTTDNTIYVDWSGAADPESGVYGYGLWWSQNPDDIPSATVDTLNSFYTSSALPSGDGWYLHIRSRDNAGNWAAGAYHAGPFRIDTVNPSTSYSLEGTTGLMSWYVTLVNITLLPSDSHSGIDTTYININGTGWTTYSGKILLNTQGTYTIQYYSTDNVGHTESTNNLEVKIDSVAPSSSAIVSGTPSGGWYNADISITLSSTDATSGLDDFLYRIDGGIWTSYSTAIDFTTEGTFTLEFYGEDHAGNDETTHTLTIRLDKSNPTWDDAPTNQLLPFGVPLRFDCNASDNLSGISAWGINDTSNFEINGAGVLVSDGLLNAGTYGLEIVVTDVAGNELVALITITQQAPPPGIPGFPAYAIVLGLFAALSLGIVLRRRRKPI